MSKIIIYDNKNILVAELEKTETEKIQETSNVIKREHKAIFKDYKIINSQRIRKELKKIEKAIKYHEQIGGKDGN